MTPVAKSQLERGQIQTSMVDIWIQIRGLENALRHYGDVFAGWMEYGGQDPRKGMSGMPRQRAIPKPHACNPPWCIPPMPATVKEIRQVAEAVDDVAAAFKFLAQHIHVEEDQDIYVSEIPGVCWPNDHGNGHGHAERDRR